MGTFGNNGGQVASYETLDAIRRMAERGELTREKGDGRTIVYGLAEGSLYR